MAGNDSLEFLSRNACLAGFSNDDIPFMCLKEAVENSVDACRKKAVSTHGNEEMHISIKFTSDKQHVQISVDDVGAGIELQNLDLLGKTFGTNSSTSEHLLMGKFGVGLKLLIIHAAGEGVEMSVRVSPSVVWTFMLCYSKGTEIYIKDLQKRQHSTSEWPFNTGVHTMCVKPNHEVYDESVSNMYAYLQLIAAWNDNIRFTATIDEHTHTWNENKNTHTAPNELCIPCELINHSGEGSKVLTDTNEDSSVACVYTTEAYEDETTHSDALIISVYRAANNTPMLCLDGCVGLIHDGVKKSLSAHGHKFGLTLTRSELQSEGKEKKCRNSASMDFVVTKYDASKLKRIIMFFNVRAKTIDFANLSKSYIKSTKLEIKRVCGLTLRTFASVKESYPDSLRSDTEIKSFKAKNVYIPMLANAVADILTISDDHTFVDVCVHMLGLKGVDDKNVPSLDTSNKRVCVSNVSSGVPHTHIQKRIHTLLLETTNFEKHTHTHTHTHTQEFEGVCEDTESPTNDTLDFEDM